MIPLVITTFLLVLVAWQKPTLDRTRHGALLLWYGHRKRRYVVLQHRH